MLPQSLLSRPVAPAGNGAPLWGYPAERLILMGGALAAVGTIAIFASVADTPGGLPEYSRKHVCLARTGRYGASSLQHARFKRFSPARYHHNRSGRLAASAAWQSANRAGAGRVQRKNLRPTPDYDRLQLPPRLVFLLAGFALARWFDGTLSTLMAIFLALVTSAYFLLGLAIIHAISRPWNGRGWLLWRSIF